MILVKNVVNQEMKQIIIVMNVLMIINFLLILHQQKIIAIKIVITNIILMKPINILVQHLIHVLLNIVN